MKRTARLALWFAYGSLAASVWINAVEHLPAASMLIAGVALAMFLVEAVATDLGSLSINVIREHVPSPSAIAALAAAESFIAGCEDDDTQDVADLLAQIRAARGASSCPTH